MIIIDRLIKVLGGYTEKETQDLIEEFGRLSERSNAHLQLLETLYSDAMADNKEIRNLIFKEHGLIHDENIPQGETTFIGGSYSSWPRQKQNLESADRKKYWMDKAAESNKEDKGN